MVIYGNSLLLSGIGASLKRRTGLNVVFFDPAPVGATERLNALRPDVVAFDVGEACPDSAIALWRAQPQLLLVGVDLENDQAQVLSGQVSTVLSADGLVELIETQTCLERRNP